MAGIPDAQRLDGWKAIANFLGRERTTAIRWANDRGLPVHRVPGGRTGTVFALRSELEAWLASDQRDAAEQAKAVASADAAVGDRAPAIPTETRATSRPTRTAKFLLALALAGAVTVAVAMKHRAPVGTPPISIAAVAAPNASPDTLAFARGLNTDLARFANASPDIAIFEGEPGKMPSTQYAVRAEIEPANGRMIAYARLAAQPGGQVIWSRRFEQSGPALSPLRQEVAASLIDVLRCGFGGLEAERAKVRPADLEQLLAICESFNARDFQAAEPRARQLTKDRPDLSLGWVLLAMIQGAVAGEDHVVRAKALANSRVAASIAPDGVNTWLARAAASHGGPTSQEALPVIDAALRVHPDEPWLLESRSVILFNLGYVQASVVDALRAVRNDASSFDARDIAVRRLAAAGQIAAARLLQDENERLWFGNPRVIANREQIIANSHAADIAAIGEASARSPESHRRLIG